MFNTQNVIAMAVAALSFMTAGCSSTATDPSTVPPNAQLEVFGTKSSTVSINVTDKTSAAAVPKPTRVDPNDLVIRATGSQLDKGLGNLVLSIQAAEPAHCNFLQPDRGVVSTLAHTPGVVEATANAPADRPQGILQLTYNLPDYLARITCVDSKAKFDGTIRLQVKVTNIKGLSTTTPEVQLLAAQD